MARDYAKQRVVQRRKPKRVRLVLLLCLFVSLLLVGILLLIYQSPRLKGWHFNLQAYQTSKKVADHTGQKTNVPPEEIHFHFYSELPEMKVTPGHAADNEIVPPKKENVTEEKGYIVQLGLYNDSSEASQARLSLLLGGFETEIVKVTIQGKINYRLQKGPFPSQSEAVKIQKKLQQKGIESIVNNLK